MMRRRHRLLAPVLVLGGVVSATGGATIIDMPAAPHAARSGDEVQEPSESAPAKTPGEVALDRYAGERCTPAYTSMASSAWWGWPYGRYGYGYGAYPYRGWGWGWPWGWGRGWYGWGFRSPYFGYRRHGTGLSFRGRPR